MENRITISNHSYDITKIIFSGRMDADSREYIKANLHQALSGNARTIVLDLKSVPFIDSSGLAALVSGLKQARESKKNIVLTHLSKQAQMVFNLTMLDKVFSIYPSMEAALDALS